MKFGDFLALFYCRCGGLKSHIVTAEFQLNDGREITDWRYREGKIIVTVEGD